jgi:arylsulfatase A
MNRTPRCTFLIGLALSLAAEGLAAETAVPDRPNVILFLVDDLGYGDLACHGNQHVQTPSIDAFARDDVAARWIKK